MCSAEHRGDYQEVMTMTKIEVREAMSDEAFHDIQFLHRTVWGLDDLDVTPTHIYSAVEKNGGVILCAYDRGRPVGFVFAFNGLDVDGPYLYLHNIGVLPELRGRGVAFILETALAKRALAKSVNLVKWTFDPLESANAHLYIHKLRATSDEYIQSYFDEMTDRINLGLPSDRLIIKWRIDEDLIESISSNEATRPDYDSNDVTRLNRIEQDAEGLPRPVDLEAVPRGAAGGGVYLLEIPSNLDHLKRTSMDTAIEWRMHVRNLLEACFSARLVITDTVFDNPRFHYLLTPGNPKCSTHAG